MSKKHPVLITWSEEDRSFIARVLGLPGCMADGSTPQEALENAYVAAEAWVEVAEAPNPDRMAVDAIAAIAKAFDSMLPKKPKVIARRYQKQPAAKAEPLPDPRGLAPEPREHP